MKSVALLKAVYKDCLDRGYVQVGDNLYPPNHPAAIAFTDARSKRKPRKKYRRTGSMDDDLNIKHKTEIKDMFTMLMEKEGIPCWPEFLFMPDRKYAMDYAWPEYKLCLEVEGGIHLKGNSGHSSGVGIKRDMDKISMSASLGWRTLRVTPSDLFTIKTLDLIKKSIFGKKNMLK
jgi:hypothetical protein